MMTWKLDLGANLTSGGGASFRLWAPDATTVHVVRYNSSGPSESPMTAKEDGTFSADIPDIRHGDLYKFRIDGGPAYPDPYSRSQPLGVHGPSQLIDPDAFRWYDSEWRGIGDSPLIIYECHVGTFTEEGTFDALAERLDYLRSLGMNMIELMPVASFPGRWNWGYDGVDLFAPSNTYGGSDGLKRLVDAAHSTGLGIMLDVVYNHLGPDGNYLWSYSKDYFTTRYRTPWGEALNFDGPNNQWVRRLVISNAHYWVNEFHVDGLRLDAVHAIFDESPVHILRELNDSVRASGHPRRSVHLIAEDSRNLVQIIDPPEKGGFGFDGVWADDFHHTVRTMLTNERQGYFADYPGSLASMARTIEQGFFYQGEYSKFRRSARGTPVTDQQAKRFVFCIQNHDQVGNRPFGDRLNHTVTLEQYATASAVLLLAPETPLIFMGQEYAASTPFQYFTDHNRKLGALVTEGRRKEFREFMAAAASSNPNSVPDPQARGTFYASKLREHEQGAEPHASMLRLYKDLIALRSSDQVLREQDRELTRARAEGESVLIIHRMKADEHRLIIANFGDPTTVSLDDAIGPEDVPGVWNLVLSTNDYFDVNPSMPDGLSPRTREGQITVPQYTALVLSKFGVGRVEALSSQANSR